MSPGMMASEAAARRALVAACREMAALGITQGTSGNIALRHGARLLVSPSSVPYAEMTPEQVASMPIENEPDAEDGAWSGPCPPSSEWRLHLSILRARPELGAVVHGHPTFCTALAMARRDIPACHYMIAVFGGADVRCAPYAAYGTAALAGSAVRAMRGRQACLLANHGMVAAAGTLARAMWLASELETLARQYCHALAIGGPVLLSNEEAAEAANRLRGYGMAAKPIISTRDP